MMFTDRRNHTRARILFIDVAVLWAQPKVRVGGMVLLLAFLLWAGVRAW